MSEQPLPAPVAALLVTSQSWLRRYLPLLLLGLGLLAVGAFLLAAYEDGRFAETGAQAPVLRKQEARALVAQSRRDSVVVVTYKTVARAARHRAAKDSTRAAAAEAQADLFKTRHEKLPAVVTGPFSAVVRALTEYTSPDSAHH